MGFQSGMSSQQTEAARLSQQLSGKCMIWQNQVLNVVVVRSLLTRMPRALCSQHPAPVHPATSA